MTQKPKCTKCGSGQIYYRRILKDFVCRRCGLTWKPKALVKGKK